MKICKNIILVTCLVLINCNSSSSQLNTETKTIGECTQSIHKIKSERKFSFRIGKTFGYKKLRTGETISISGIVLHDDCAYLGNQYFSNLQSINIMTGELKNGEKIKRQKEFDDIWDIAYLNKHIYAITSITKNILVFDTTLKLISRNINPNFSAIHGSNIVYSEDDSLEFVYFWMPGIHTIKINKKNIIRRDSLKINSDENFRLSDLGRNSIRGKRFKEINIEGRNYLSTEDGCFELKEKISRDEFNSSFNFDFTNDKIVYFDVNSKYFTLHVYEY